MFLTLGFGAAGGLINAFAGDSQRKQQNEAINRAQDMLRENLITPAEYLARTQQVSKTFGAVRANVANTAAFSSRGLANQGVAMASALSNVEAQKANALTETLFRTESENAATTSQIAQLELNRPQGSFMGDFASGALSGVATGIQLEELMDLNSKLDMFGKRENNVDNVDATPALDYSGDINKSISRSPQPNYVDMFSLQEKLGPAGGELKGVVSVEEIPQATWGWGEGITPSEMNKVYDEENRLKNRNKFSFLNEGRYNTLDFFSF